MVVQAVGVLVGGDQHLKPAAPYSARQLHPDVVALAGCHLAGAEALVGVQRHRAACLAEPPLHCPHVRPGLPCPAMQAGDQQHLLAAHIGGQPGLGVIPGVVKRLGQAVPGQCGLLGVGGVVEHPL